MNRSSRFISLSGLSGVVAGIFALIGAFTVHLWVFPEQEFPGYEKVELTIESLSTLLIIGFTTLLMSLVTCIYFTRQEARKREEKLWDLNSQRLVVNLLIPLVTGGLLILILIGKGYIGITIPFTLIFYGLALTSASKYTLGEIRSLGIAEVVIGLLSALFINYSLLLWTIGFGLLHIVYGILMHLRYRP